MSDDVPFAESLCHRCRNLRLVRSGKGSTFLMCQAPELPKYPRQPVVTCAAFSAIDPLGPVSPPRR